MDDLSVALSQVEFEWLNDFLMSRITDDVEIEKIEMGLLSVSELDGFLTALASGPVTILPSHWLPALWGDLEPRWGSEKEFKQVFSLIIRHLNSIHDVLMNIEEFEPLFSEVAVEGRSYMLVEDWCHGYMQGVSLAEDEWYTGGLDMRMLLVPIDVFSSLEGLKKLDQLNETEIDNLQNAIVPNVREIYTYWLAHRQDVKALASTTVHRETPRTGRNDPCPCGSGKKYKKCCLQ